MINEIVFLIFGIQKNDVRYEQNGKALTLKALYI